MATPGRANPSLMPDYKSACVFPINLLHNVQHRGKLACVFSPEENPHIAFPTYQFACGELACQRCVNKNINGRKVSCPGPVCKKEPPPEEIEKSNIFADKARERELNSLTVQCIYAKKCKWKGEFGQYRNQHMSDCPKIGIEQLIEENEYLKHRYENNTTILNNQISILAAENEELRNRNQLLEAQISKNK